MNKALFFILLLTASLKLAAQRNLFYATPTNVFIPPGHIVESGNSIYYLSLRYDTLATGKLTRSYYLNRINKVTYGLTARQLVLIDTAFNPKDEFFDLPVSFGLDPKTRRLNIFLVSDADSSAGESSAIMRYPRRISYLQLDADLSTTIPVRPLVYTQRGGRYALAALADVMTSADGQAVLYYGVRDTNINQSPNSYSTAGKFLFVDKNGKVSKNDFLGWEPPLTSSTRFPSHNLTDIWQNYDGTFMAKTWFESFPSLGYMFTLFQFDKDFNLTDTFDYPMGHYGASLPGKAVYHFAGVPENHFFLPTGSLVRSGEIEYRDAITGVDHVVFGVGIGGRNTGYRTTRLYAPPIVDDSDIKHGSSYSSATYSQFDNGIYNYSATHNFNGPCNADNPGFGQLVALDTNLSERWIKYVLPKPGHCISSLAVFPCDGRSGVLVTGWHRSPTPPGGFPLWHPYIYHIDSSTALGVDHPESPIIITDRFRLFPNPATEYLTIEAARGESYSYSVINRLGQVVASSNAQGRSTRVNVEELPAGVYLVRIVTADNRSSSLKFMKQ